MSCPKEEKLQAFIDGELTAESGESVRSHLPECLRCTEIVQDLTRASFIIAKAFAAELPELAPTARLRAKIESELTEHSLPRFRWFSLLRRFRWAGVALLLLAGIIGLRLMTKPVVDLPKEAQRLPSSLRPELVQNENTEPPKKIKSMPVSTRRTPVPRKIHRSQPSLHETPMPFYSLVAEDEIAPLESGRIVRIEVPAATLVKLGIPLSDATLTQPMQADLLLGQDGLARAIRFLPYPQTTKTQ